MVLQVVGGTLSTSGKVVLCHVDINSRCNDKAERYKPRHELMPHTHTYTHTRTHGRTHARTIFEKLSFSNIEKDNLSKMVQWFSSRRAHSFEITTITIADVSVLT